MKLNYLTEEEAKMPQEFALGQIALGLQTCKTNSDAVKLLEDAVEIGRRQMLSPEFNGMRDKYPLLCSVFQFLTPGMRAYFSKGDTLASNENINPDYWNDEIIIFRRAFEKSFEVYADYTYSERFVEKGKYKDRKDHRKRLYDSAAQKSLRLMIDLLCTMALEDTVYREQLNMFLFELQYLMNAKFNPEIQQYHVLYMNFMASDPNYYQMVDQIGKARRITPDYHTKAAHIGQQLYADRKAEAGVDSLK